jgi:hypothetical protein
MPGGRDRGDDRDGKGGGGPLTWYGDSAYGIGDLRGAISDAGHQAVIKPKPLQAPVQGGLTIDDFTVSERVGAVTCPARNTVALSRTRVATFGALGRDCPLRQRSLLPRPAASWSCTNMMTCCAPPAHWAVGPGLREDYWAHRPNVERAIAQVATVRGRRLKLRHRGGSPRTTSTQAPHRREEPAQPDRAGLAWRGGAWVLATDRAARPAQDTRASAATARPVSPRPGAASPPAQSLA